MKLISTELPELSYDRCPKCAREWRLDHDYVLKPRDQVSVRIVGSKPGDPRLT